MSRRLRIADVRSIPVATSWRTLLFVEVETEDGRVGLGEATTEWFEEAVEAHVRSLARRYVRGSDVFEIDSLVEQVVRDDYWPTNIVLNSALAGIELACWDLKGQVLEEPVYRLLGGARRKQIEAYANGWYRANRTPHAFASAAKSAVELGYRALKLDPFGAAHLRLDDRELRFALDLVAAVRNEVGEGVQLFIDAHGRFLTDGARKILHELPAYNVGWVEEPVPPEAVHVLAQVGTGRRVPIAAGERVFSSHQAESLLSTGALDVFQPDPIHSGGITQTLRRAAQAERAGVAVALHNSNGPVATAACLHLHLAMQHALIQEVFDDFDEAWLFELVEGAPRVTGGVLEAPTAPGLGVRLSHAVAAAHPPAPLDFNHWQEGWERRATPFDASQPTAGRR